MLFLLLFLCRFFASVRSLVLPLAFLFMSTMLVLFHGFYSFVWPIPYCLVRIVHGDTVAVCIGGAAAAVAAVEIYSSQ